MTGASLLVLMSATALAVDLGHSTYRKKVLQAGADLVALDAVRAVGDRYLAGADLQTRVETFAQESADRNELDTTGWTVQVGEIDWNTNTFTTPPPGGPDTANAVRILLEDSVDHQFLPGVTSFGAESIAGIDAQGSIEVGSSIVRFNSATTPFDPLLEDMLGVSFNAAEYSGLAGAEVALGDLWLALGLGSSDEVANSTVTVADAFDAMASALNAQGDTASATAMQDQKASIKAGSSFSFGEVIDIGAASPNEVAGAQVNVLRMISLMATAANGNGLVSATLPVTIPGVASVTVKMGVIEPPQIAIGPARTDALGDWVTQARTAQTRMQFTLVLATPLTVAGQTFQVTLPVYLASGGADGSLTGIDCQTPLSDSPATVHVDTAASSGNVGNVGDSQLVGGPVTVGTATLVSHALLTVTGSSSYSVAPSSHDLTFVGPFDRAPQTVGISNTQLDQLAAGLTVTATPSLGLGLGVSAATIATQVRTLITPVVEALDTTLVDALMATPMGFHFAGADVSNLALNCAIRRLAG